jgi:hypothetical protein
MAERKFGRQRKCKTCGELEMVGQGAEFGWFTDAEDKTWCQRCGSDPQKAPKKAKS